MKYLVAVSGDGMGCQFVSFRFYITIWLAFILPKCKTQDSRSRRKQTQCLARAGVKGWRWMGWDGMGFHFLHCIDIGNASAGFVVDHT